MKHHLNLPPMETIGQKIKQIKAMQYPEHSLHDAVKEEKDVDWQETSHEWTMQNCQSGVSTSHLPPWARLHVAGVFLN